MARETLFCDKTEIASSEKAGRPISFFFTTSKKKKVGKRIVVVCSDGKAHYEDNLLPSDCLRESNAADVELLLMRNFPVALFEWLHFYVRSLESADTEEKARIQRAIDDLQDFIATAKNIEELQPFLKAAWTSRSLELKKTLSVYQQSKTQ